MVPHIYTTLCKSSLTLSMVNPICAFLLVEQQLFPLSRLGVCLGYFLRCVYLVSWGFLTNCDQDLGLARSSRAGRSVHPSSSHQVWNTNRCLPHVIGTLWAWAGRAGCVCMLRAVTTAFCIWGKLMAHLGAVEKQQKKCGIFTSCFTSCDSKALILTGRALHLCCCTLHLLSDDS